MEKHIKFAMYQAFEKFNKKEAGEEPPKMSAGCGKGPLSLVV